MSVLTSKGQAAADASNEQGGSAQESIMTSFKSGTTLKVAVGSLYDVAEYYGYSIFKRVNTFVPKRPAERNARGFVTANPTLWDRASDLLYKDVKAAEEAGADAKEIDALKAEAGLYRAKQRFLRAFYDLTTGKYVVVDLSAAQERVIKSAIEENADDLADSAFKLAKKGEGKAAAVSLSLIAKIERDLTADERANFAKFTESAVPAFDLDAFESCLYVADEEEQRKNLIAAGFDIARLEGAGSGAASSGGSSARKALGGDYADDGKSVDISDDDLPF